MKIALAQMEVIPGMPEKNLERMLEMIEQAKDEKVDLISFPEMCIGGYLLSDKFLEDEFCLDLMEFNYKILEASDNITIAYGNIFIDNNINNRISDNKFHPNKDGRSRKYNAAYVVQNKKPVEKLHETKFQPMGVQAKTLLPNYRFFDDERYFFSLQDIAEDFRITLEKLLSPFLIEIKGKKIPIGFELCEDLWCEDYRRNSEALDSTKILIENGAKYIINLSASPWTFGKNAARDRRIRFLKKESGENFVPFFYVNCVGAQNNGKNIITFDGGSTIYNRQGLPIFLSKQAYAQELLVVTEADLEKKPIERIESPKIAQKYEAIIKGINHIKNILGKLDHPRFVVGLSGGIDSAVIAALLTKAVGKGKVLGVNMPSKYNSNKTKRSANFVANQLGIGYEVIPIGELTELNRVLIDSIDPEEEKGRKLSDYNMENLQAKIRGTSLLSNIAAKYNAIFTNNGNKLEIALGYATLYGDIGGAIAPIGDLTKTEIVELAHYLNKEIFKKEIIPEELIPNRLWEFKEDQIQPSAELKENQIDPMRFGYHCALIEAITDYKKRSPEEILRWYRDGKLAEKLGISKELIKRWDIDNPEEFVKDLEWFISSIQNNVFKRVQSPPIIVTSKSAYGYDIRESMLPYTKTKEYEKLKLEILGGKK